MQNITYEQMEILINNIFVMASKFCFLALVCYDLSKFLAKKLVNNLFEFIKELKNKEK